MKVIDQYPKSTCYTVVAIFVDESMFLPFYIKSCNLFKRKNVFNRKIKKHTFPMKKDRDLRYTFRVWFVNNNILLKRGPMRACNCI